MSQFTPTSIDQQGLRIAQFLPTGKAWDAATDTNKNMGKLFRGLGVELYRLELLIQTVNREGDINQTVELIRDWETAVGIPDDCFTDITDVSEQGLIDRRNNVILKLQNIRIQSAQDYIDLALNSFGETIAVTPGGEAGLFPLKFPFVFFASGKVAKFTIIIDFEENESIFPLPFPFPFVTGVTGVLQCVFTKIKPANCNILFRFGFI